MFHKTKNKNKKYFWKSCLQCFRNENVWQNKEVCLSINGAQSVRLKKGTIEFENHFKQIPFPFKIYPDFECNLKRVLKVIKGSTQKNIKITFLLILVTSLLVLMINLVNRLLFLEVKMQPMNLLKRFLKNISIIKK